MSTYKEIDTSIPNPFLVDSQVSQWRTNELLMRDPKLRVCAGVAQLDIGQKYSHHYRKNIAQL
jgi:hypothetical protein